MIRVLIADDKALVRNGICAMLLRAKDMEVLGEAHDGMEAVELVQSLHPDVVTMDLNMPRLDGFAATKQITTKHPNVRVVVVAMSRDEQSTSRALESGALGYIAKTDMFQEIVPGVIDRRQRRRLGICEPLKAASAFGGVASRFGVCMLRFPAGGLHPSSLPCAIAWLDPTRCVATSTSRARA